MAYLITSLFVRLTVAFFIFLMMTFGVLYGVYEAGYQGIYQNGWVIAAALCAMPLASALVTRIGRYRVKTFRTAAHRALQFGHSAQALDSFNLALRWLDAGWVGRSTRNKLRHDVLVEATTAGLPLDRLAQGLQTPRRMRGRPRPASLLAPAFSVMSAVSTTLLPVLRPGIVHRRWLRRFKWAMGFLVMGISVLMAGTWLWRHHPSASPPLMEPRAVEYVSTNQFTVQAGAYRTQDEAEDMVRAIQQRGEQAYWRKATVTGKGVFYQVRLGDFPTKQEAARYCRLRKRQGIIPRDSFVAAFEGGFVTVDSTHLQTDRYR